MARYKGVLTTGEVARVCQVAPRTVAKWFDSGVLKGYRVPGSKDRRIPIGDLVRFMREHGMPLDGLDTGATRVLLVDPDSERRDTLAKALSQQPFLEVQAAESPFAAGVAAARFAPHVVLLEPAPAEIRKAVEAGASSARETEICFKLVGIAADASEAEELRRGGYDECLVRPFNISDVIRVIDAILGPDRP
jgi:excisionase family DNA binding protein